MKLLEEYTLIGSNRRCADTIIELWLEASEEECRVLGASSTTLHERILEVLAQCGVEPAPTHVLLAVPSGSPVENYARLLGGIALALQQHAGHRVGFLGLYPAGGQNRCCVAVEYEQSDVGNDACGLAVHLLAELCPETALAEMPIEDYRGFRVHFDRFMSDAPPRVLPRDAQAIIEAAARLDVPCVKLDRDPYEGVQGDFRIRPNGMLKLGHACHQRVVDGTFPIDSAGALAALAHDRAAAVEALASLGFPLPRRDPGSGVCISARHAVRAAERIGYPVLVKPQSLRRAQRGAGAAQRLEGPEPVRAAAERILRTSRGVMVEQFVPGRPFKVIVADQEVVAVVALEKGAGVADVTADAHASILEGARRAASQLRAALLTLTVVSPDIGRPLQECGAVVNLNVAPELDSFLEEQAPVPARAIMDRAAEGLVRHLFPAGTKSRIPLVAVTGTNGKTTICALIERAVMRAGFVTGRAGTTGFFLNGECIEFDDLSGGSGHHRVLESPTVQFGILETARGAVMAEGLMFDRCDVAVCTNVTPDHLGQRGIETVAQMAELKQLIMQRAGEAVVLNADNEYSVGMLPQLAGRRAWLVSAQRSAEHLRGQYGEEVNLCVAELEGDTEWVVLYQAGRRVPVMPVGEVAITYGGRVRYNVSNALQAIAACSEMGLPLAVIRQTVAGFTPAYEDNPGRLNFYRGLPFTVLMDFAHNADGFRQLADFADTCNVGGRKVILYANEGRLTDQDIMALAGVVAGRFDAYVCRNYPDLYGRRPEEVPALMKRALVDRGVPDSSVTEAPGGDATEVALRACRPGDLLVVCTSTHGLHDEWKTITTFAPAETVTSPG